MTKKCNFICPICGIHHLKDPDNLLDYADTEWGVILQSFCQECGRMEPLIQGYRLNKKILRTYAIRIAMKFGLDFDRCKKIAKESDGVDYIESFSKDLSLTPEQVSSAIRWRGHKRNKSPAD